MKFGYMIIYVPDVAASLQFFSSAFGLSIRFLHESATYGELETGETVLAFAADELAAMNFSTWPCFGALVRQTARSRSRTGDRGRSSGSCQSAASRRY